MRVDVFLAIGSNVAPQKNLPSGIEAIRSHFGGLTCSPIYASPAMGFDGEAFLNCVVHIATDRPLADIIEQLSAIEISFGRAPDSKAFTPRALDIDLLLYGDRVVFGPELTLPRSDILHYPFVLRPLADIAGSRKHPLFNLSFAELWDTYRDKSSLTPIKLSPLEAIQV